MFASERRKKICQMLMDYKSVDVSRLSKLFNISTVTIRKDLELLESEGILTRTHGGAILNDSFPQQEHTPDAVEDMCNPEESLIATIASHFIQDDEFIFLGTGSICTQISRILPEKKNLTIVTNNISAAIHLNITAITVLWMLFIQGSWIICILTRSSLLWTEFRSIPDTPLTTATFVLPIRMYARKRGRLSSAPRAPSSPGTPLPALARQTWRPRSLRPKPFPRNIPIISTVTTSRYIIHTVWTIFRPTDCEE